MRVFALTLAVLLGTIVAVNAAASWHQSRRDAALRAAAGELRPGLVVGDYRDVDERGFQRARLEALPAPRVLALGSSRIMQLTTAALDLLPGEFYNAGMAGAVVEDFAALWTMLDRQGKVPRVAVIAIDPWTFNAGRADVRWLALAEEGESRRSLATLEQAAYRWYWLTELASYPVLRKTVGDARRALRRVDSRVVVPESALAGRQGLRWDGSLRYEARYLAQLPAGRREAADRYAAKLAAGLAAFRWDAARAARLVQLWKDMRQRNVRVVTFVAPYHPRAWSVVRTQLGPTHPMTTGVASLRAAANGLGVVFADLADPARIPCGEDEFLDGDHATAECLGRALIALGVAGPANH